MLPTEFRILGETEDYLAVDKPAGLLVHPTKPDGRRTLWNGLRELLGYELATGGQISLINRLDRETSGIVLIAKNAAAARRAGLAMQQGKIHKRYQALVFGWPEWEECEVNAPIIRLGEIAPSRIWLQRSIHAQGAPSRTRFRIECRQELSYGRRFALVRAWPLTGRTHQIRVHLAHVGYPVIGDKIYARGGQDYLDFIADGWTAEMAEALWLSRHALHCEYMALDDEEWHSPLASDLARFLIQ